MAVVDLNDVKKKAEAEDKCRKCDLLELALADQDTPPSKYSKRTLARFMEACRAVGASIQEAMTNGR
jgi:hypothetical protein